MEKFFNKCISIIKTNQTYLWVAIPFLFILLFLSLFILLFQSPSNTKKIAQITPIATPTDIPETNVESIPLGSPLNTAQAEALNQQGQIEDAYIQNEKTIQQNYPWLDKLPLQSNDYFFYFDTDNKTFVGKLYPKNDISTSIDDQVTSLKKTITDALTNLGIPTTIPIDWQIFPVASTNEP